MNCPHAEQDSGRRVCSHLLEGLQDSWTVEQFSHYRRFTGKSLDYVLTCPNCQEQPLAELSWVCGECFVDIAHGSRLGNLGTPEVAERESSLQLQTIDRWPSRSPVTRAVAFGNSWAAINEHNELLILEAGRRRAFPLDKWGMQLAGPALLVAADPFVAIACKSRGIVVDVSAGQLSRSLEYATSLAFTPQNQLIHSSQANRLELSNPAGGGTVKALRVPKDYHQSGISLAPGGQWLALNGYIRESMGEVRVLNISDDGHSRPLCQRDGFWDGPLVWLGPSQLGVAGLGSLDVMLLPGLRRFDLESQQELPSIAGPEGPFAFDELLFCHSPARGFSAWDLEAGQRIFHDPQFHPLAYHPGQKAFLSQHEQSLILSRLQ